MAEVELSPEIRYDGADNHLKVEEGRTELVAPDELSDNEIVEIS